jgi:hypothetical protein
VLRGMMGSIEVDGAFFTYTFINSQSSRRKGMPWVAHNIHGEFPYF